MISRKAKGFLFFLALGLIALPAAANESFGKPLSKMDPLPLQSVVANKKLNEKVQVTAQVDQVCQKKGCWMILKDQGAEARITFEDYGFFVPISLVGKTVLVEGVLKHKTLSLSETKHYVKDAGGDPSTVKVPRTEYSLVASGVQVVQPK